ncbi:MAG: transcription elongation factor GreA [Candidatus Izimaplasma sp.]|nr:transcription elongation factor GreA [Candidatus Izimaplasma bacterium]
MDKAYLTKQGLEELKLELEDLKTNKRKENLEALKEARAQGDLSENADYDSARNEQAELEARIKEIEGILKNYEIIKEDLSNKVNIGKTVTININDVIEETYTIVGALETDPQRNRISNESPIGKGIIGTEKGDKLKIKTEANKEVMVKIVDVK